MIIVPSGGRRSGLTPHMQYAHNMRTEQILSNINLDVCACLLHSITNGMGRHHRHRSDEPDRNWKSWSACFLYLGDSIAGNEMFADAGVQPARSECSKSYINVSVHDVWRERRQRRRSGVATLGELCKTTGPTFDIRRRPSPFGRRQSSPADR